MATESEGEDDEELDEATRKKKERERILKMSKIALGNEDKVEGEIRVRFSLAIRGVRADAGYRRPLASSARSTSWSASTSQAAERRRRAALRAPPRTSSA